MFDWNRFKVKSSKLRNLAIWNALNTDMVSGDVDTYGSEFGLMDTRKYPNFEDPEGAWRTNDLQLRVWSLYGNYYVGTVFTDGSTHMKLFKTLDEAETFFYQRQRDYHDWIYGSHE